MCPTRSSIVAVLGSFANLVVPLGCASDTIVLELPLLEERARSVIIASERGGAVVETVALDRDDLASPGPGALLDVGPEETVAFTVIGLEEALDPLGLAAATRGPVARGSGRPLATLRSRGSIRRATVGPDGPTPWEKQLTPDLPPALASVELPSTRGCRRFSIETLPPLADAAAFIVPMGGRHLVGTEHHRLVPIPPIGTATDATPPPGFLPPGETVFPTWGAHPIADRPDQLWLAARDGKLWRVRFDAEGRPAEVLDVVRTGREHAIRWMAGQATSTRTRLVFLGLDSSVGIFDGTQARVVHQYQMVTLGNWAGGIAVADDGTIIAGRNIGGEIVVVRPDDSVELLRLSEDVYGVMDVENVPGIGVLLSDTSGHLFRWSGARFDAFEDSGVRAGVEAIVPIAGGFLTAGNYGAVREWRSQGGFCEPIMPLVLQTLRWWSPVDAHTFLVSGPFPSGGTDGEIPLSRIRFD